jgi:hypothetical protein
VRVHATGLALAAAVSLAACGSSGAPSATTTATYHPLVPPTTSTATALAAPAFPAVGTAQHVRAGATTLSVTIRRLLEPLDGSHARLPPHTRAVGVIALIRNDGPGVYDSSSTGDFSIVPSAGAATPVFAAAGACQTPLRDWDNEISPGEVRSGCVAFALGAHAKVTQVRFSPHARAAGRATWSVGR